MLNTQSVSRHLSKVNFSQLPQVVREFRIGAVDCLVIVIDNNVKYSLNEKNLNSYLLALNISEFSEISRFPIKDYLCEILGTVAHSSNVHLDLPDLLTERKLQIVNLVAQGYPNKQIAKQLHISEWAVATYLLRIFATLGIDSRAALVYRCADFIRKPQVLEEIQI